MNAVFECTVAATIMVRCILVLFRLCRSVQLQRILVAFTICLF